MVLEEAMLKPQLSHIALWPKAPQPQRENPCLSTGAFHEPTVILIVWHVTIEALIAGPLQ